MSKQTKALLFNFIGFAIIFFPARYLFAEYANFKSWQIPLAAFIVATLLSPKFKAIRTSEGEKLFMSWMFTKGVKEIKK
ncbi:Protein of unknown function [Flavobacterium indicum GPTSA100-9 = DSM 17447]|uniref:Uncharacterized protein n=1 Tax=Flavobacterium indicum (strain DSM 17447 / CIP 109464 / GPTSA100-9) TaxID=1094466 RepID=H8XSM4_FLAIG|nr:hypothetical protein [Flavobacterium indicum]CCG52609.1 Protein of unknown function [Flavobacterium indicum GPTSA100-9 = DSM 17447]